MDIQVRISDQIIIIYVSIPAYHLGEKGDRYKRALCRRVEEHKLRCLMSEEEKSGAETNFKAYGNPLTMLSSFK